MRKQHRVAICHLQMEVCPGCVAAVAEKRDDVAAMNAGTSLYPDAFPPQVGICDEAVRRNLKDDLISGDTVRRGPQAHV